MAVNDPESFQCRLNIVGPPRQSGISDTLWHVQSLEAGNSTGDGGEYSSAECLETHPTCRQHSEKAIGIFFSVFCWPDTNSYKFYHFPQCNKAYILQIYDPWKFPHVGVQAQHCGHWGLGFISGTGYFNHWMTAVERSHAPTRPIDVQLLKVSTARRGS